jgi:uncharacterized protein (TIGR03437 family)
MRFAALARIWQSTTALIALCAGASALAQQLPVVEELRDASQTITMVAAPGSQIGVFGQNLVIPNTMCLPTELPVPTKSVPCGFSATVGGAATAVLRAFSSEAIVLLPWDLETGPSQLVVTVEGTGASEPFDLTIQKYAPAYLFFGISGSAFYKAADFTPYTPESPARAGQFAATYASGLGNTENDPALGDPGPTDPLGRTLGTTRVFLQKVSDEAPGIAQNEGEIEARVLISTLVPQLANSYRINFELPADLQAGNYNVVLQMSDADGGNVVRSAPAPLPVGTPPLSLNSAVNGASFAQGPIAPGTLVSAFIAGLTVSENHGLFPETVHEGVSVTFDGVAAPLFHALPAQNQINLLAPNDLPVTGTVNIVVTSESGDSEPLEVELTEAAPGIFPINEPGGGRVFAAATLANTAWLPIPDDLSAALNLPINCEAEQISAGSFCGRPAKPGEAIQIYATGLGRATPGGDPAGDLLPSSETAPSDPLYWTVMKPQVTIGDLPAQLIFSGLSPGYAGLYQVNVVVPEGVPAGDEILLEITMPNGATTSALIAVQP